MEDLIRVSDQDEIDRNLILSKVDFHCSRVSKDEELDLARKCNWMAKNNFCKTLGRSDFLQS